MVLRSESVGEQDVADQRGAFAVARAPGAEPGALAAFRGNFITSKAICYQCRQVITCSVLLDHLRHDCMRSQLVSQALIA